MFDGRRILEQGGLAKTDDGLTHVISGVPTQRAIQALECRTDICEDVPKRITRVGYDAEWCAECAHSMARDIGPETGWALHEDADWLSGDRI